MRRKPATWCLTAMGMVLLGGSPLAAKPAVVYNIEQAEAVAGRTGRPLLVIAGNKG